MAPAIRMNTWILVDSNSHGEWDSDGSLCSDRGFKLVNDSEQKNGGEENNHLAMEA